MEDTLKKLIRVLWEYPLLRGVCFAFGYIFVISLFVPFGMDIRTGLRWMYALSSFWNEILSVVFLPIQWLADQLGLHRVGELDRHMIFVLGSLYWLTLDKQSERWEWLRSFLLALILMALFRNIVLGNNQHDGQFAKLALAFMFCLLVPILFVQNRRLFVWSFCIFSFFLVTNALYFVPVARDKIDEAIDRLEEWTDEPIPPLPTTQII